MSSATWIVCNFKYLTMLNQKLHGCIFSIPKCRHVIDYWMHLAAYTKFHRFLLCLPTIYTSKPRVALSFIFLGIQKSSIFSSYPHPSLVKVAPMCVCVCVLSLKKCILVSQCFCWGKFSAVSIVTRKTPCIKTTVLDTNAIFSSHKKEKILRSYSKVFGLFFILHQQ